MYAEEITDRLNVLMPKRESIHKLIIQGWNDKAIAGYMASDHKTIRRFRKAYATSTNPTPAEIIALAAAETAKYRAHPVCG